MKTRITKITMQGFKSFRKRVSIPLLDGFNVICGPNGTGKCLLGDVLVFLPDGELKPVKKIVDDALSKSKKIRMDDGFYTRENPDNVKVLTLGESLKLEERRVSAFIKRESPDKLLKILTRSGREIIVTPYHPFFSIKNGEIKSLEAKELKEGIKIATPRRLLINGKKRKITIDLFSKKDNIYVPYSPELKKEVKKVLNSFSTHEDFSTFLGPSQYSPEGLLDGQSINYGSLVKILKANGYPENRIEKFLRTIKYKNKNKTVRIPFELNECMARFLGYLISEGSSRMNNQLRFTDEDQTLIKDVCNLSGVLFQTKTNVYTYREPVKDLIIYSKPIQLFLERAFDIKVGTDSRNKTIPPIIFKSDERIITHFLAGLFDGDAGLRLSFPNDKTRCWFEYSTPNKKLAKDVFNLLLRLNIQPMLKQKNTTNTKNKTRRKHYSVLVYGVEQIKKLCGLIPFKSLNKRLIERIKNIDVDHNPPLDLIPNVNGLIRRIVKEAGVSVKESRKSCPKLQAYCENECECSRNGLLEVLEFIEKRGVITKETRRKIEYLRNLANSDVYWDEIVMIKKIKPKEKWVYDLCVDRTHNFIAGDFIVHNSNVIDAVCFALGRTSTKSMRADRLHELIYHGNPSIPPSDYASVTLWFDNSEKVFPLEAPEVSIKRKINRKGISIYKINGKTTTREKVLELLSSARIHPDGFNIIMQGDVTQVIDMSPEERRGIIDQVAGISLYDEKKEKAQKNLDIVEQRLREVEIILTERLERLQELEQDRNTALKYKDLVERLKLLNASLAYKKFQVEEDKYRTIEEQIKENELRMEELEEEIERLEKEIEVNERTRQEIVEKILIRSKEAGIKEEIEDIKNKILRNKDRIESDEREIERIDKMIEKLRSLQTRSGFGSKGVQTILSLKKPGVRGTVIDLIRTPKEYRTAVEVAAGPRLWNLVVNDVNTAIECINHLKRERIGRATFLPLDRIKPKKLKDQQKRILKRHGVIGLITDLIEYDPKYAPAIKHVFGDTIIVENLGVARQVGIGKIRMVTLDGDLAERSGAMVGGYYRKREEIASDVELEEYERVKKDLEEEINFLRIEIGQLNEKMENLRKTLEKESKDVIDLENERARLDEELERIRLQRNEKFEERIRLLDQTNKLKVKAARTEAEMSSLRLEVERYEEVEYIDEEPDVLEERIQQTTSSLNALGLVNMKAIEEYDRFKGEFDELKKRYDEVRNEKQAILDMIEKIEEKKKEVFYECLKGIDKNFREIFREIAGGEASLRLENPLDIQSGLLIQANPAGKNLVNIDAMSGGEKALTALAFLFAIQKFKPAPFYILDEVDATLDKVNTKKVTEMIKKLSKKEQFIVITHNDYTIKQGDRVYGISMENGESQILGIEMPEE